jgi:phage terminase large subunit-like protein
VTSSKIQRLQTLLRERAARADRRIGQLFPDEGPLRRELYAKHVEFFRAGLEHEERCFLAANRIGKTTSAGGFEVALHLTGLYPKWWEGRRFDRPTSGWAAGDTGLTTRDIIQAALLGTEQGDLGLIPKDAILKTTPKPGVPQGIDTVKVRHASGGTSVLGFKSYDQGRRVFQGTKLDFVWFDEEPPFDVYNEALMRTASTVPDERGGLMLCTFTPMEGMSETVLYFLPDGSMPGEAEA